MKLSVQDSLKRKKLLEVSEKMQKILLKKKLKKKQLPEEKKIVFKLYAHMPGERFVHTFLLHQIYIFQKVY